jgi:hypothetical protein
MAITKFKITTAPERAILQIANVDYVLNNEYSLSQQDQMSCDISNVGVPYDQFGYKLGNQNDIWSDEFFCTINALVETNTPQLSLSIIDVPHKLNEITSELSPLFDFDNNTDRIIFTEKTLPQYGSLRINNIEVVINQVYFLYQFENVFWYSSYVGLLQNVVSSFKFRVGNIDELSSEIILNFNSSGNLQGVIDIEPIVIQATLTSS